MGHMCNVHVCAVHGPFFMAAQSFGTEVNVAGG